RYCHFTRNGPAICAAALAWTGLGTAGADFARDDSFGRFRSRKRRRRNGAFGTPAAPPARPALTMSMFGYTLGVLGLCVILAVLAFLDRIYRQLGRVATGPLREHAEIFESEIEPRLKLDRRRAGSGFAILANLALVAVAVETARGVVLFQPVLWQAALQLIVYVVVEVMFCMHFVPEILIA